MYRSYNIHYTYHESMFKLCILLKHTQLYSIMLLKFVTIVQMLFNYCCSIHNCLIEYNLFLNTFSCYVFE